jgi:xanthine dehydrogenase YagS FAD-binding subunit
MDCAENSVSLLILSTDSSRSRLRESQSAQYSVLSTLLSNLPLFPSHVARDLSDALAQLSEPSRMAIGGGTDLLETIAERLVAPSGVVDIRAVPEMAGIRELEHGALRIGGAVTLQEVAQHPVVRARYPLLASACQEAGPPVVLGAATIAGNLCQRPRCPYFRRRVPCFKNGGTTCPAADASGDNRHLAIVEGGPCFIVHPSDVAVALVALEAVIEVAGPSGHREIGAADFFVLPAQRMDRETVLAGNELVLGVRLPAESAGGVQHYTKRTEEAAMGFALASLAAVRRPDGEVRLVLGGISPRPYRVYGSVEEEVMTGGMDDETIAALAERAMLDAVPLSKNGYKVELAESLLRDAIRLLASEQ